MEEIAYRIRRSERARRVRVTVDAGRGVLDLDVPEAEISRRLSLWKAREPRYKTGVFAKYCKLVSSASEGAVTRV